MRKSERIGYAIEHLLTKELCKLGYAVTRNVTPYDGAIKSDLTVSVGKHQVVVLCTHTRTTGMTNRKFYRSFAELAERRTRTPDTICVDCVLYSGFSHVRPGYGLIFKAAFDKCVSIYSDENDYVAFIRTVEENLPPTAINDEYIESLVSHIGERSVACFTVAAKQIANSPKAKSSTFSSYWKSESRNFSQPQFVSKDALETSIKGALKSCVACPDWIIANQYLLGGLIETELSLTAEEIIKLRALGVVEQARTRPGGSVVRISKGLLSGIKILMDLGIDYKSDWWHDFVSTEQSKELVRLLKSRNELLEIYMGVINTVKLFTSQLELSSYFKKIYLDKSLIYCHEIDLCIRAAGESQNELSLHISQDLNILGRGFPPPDMLIRTVLTKKKHPSAAGSINDYMDALAGRLYHKLIGIAKFNTDDFLELRCQEYLTHPYINPENIILSNALGAQREGSLRMESALPRLITSDVAVPMSVDFDYVVDLNNGRQVWIKTVSCYEERHHKHKEFSGKLRAVRAGAPSRNNFFVIVIEGKWTDSQIDMLSNTGWIVATWDQIPALYRFISQ